MIRRVLLGLAVAATLVPGVARGANPTPATRAGQLRDLAVAKNADAVQAAVKDFGRQACGACHTPFRVPPPQR